MKEKINHLLDKIFAHPIIGIPLAITIYFIPWMFIGRLGTTNVSVFAIRLAFGIVFSALIYWLRGEHMYSCGLKKQGIKAFRFILPILVVFVLAMRSKLAHYEDLSWTLFLYTAVLSLEAGFCEEMMVRAIPLGNTLWHRKSAGQMLWLAVYSSFFFGLLHLGNVMMSGDFAITGGQVVAAMFAGLYFAAVYLRSGSIIPGIVAHTLWDFFLIFDPKSLVNGDIVPIPNLAGFTEEMAKELSLTVEEARGVFIFSMILVVSAIAAVWLSMSLFLLRKSKHEEIKQNFTRE